MSQPHILSSPAVPLAFGWRATRVLLLALALVWLMPLALALAQNQLAAPAAKPLASFSVVISAPDDIKELLEQHLELQRYRELPDLSQDELTRLLDMARQDAQKLLATQGYFSPVISITQSHTEATAARLVQIKVTPGEPVQVGQVLLHFAGPIASDASSQKQRELIQATWLLPAGSRFTQEAWASAKQQALNQLTSERYAAGSISASKAEVDVATRRVKLELSLNSGPSYRLGELVATGYQHFDSTVVRRLARLPLGQNYQLKELMAAQQRLAASGFFDSALLRLDTNSDPQAARVLVALREAKLQKLTLGVGFSSDSGARFSAEHLHQLVPGLGWRALSKLSLERNNQSVSTELTALPDEDGWRRNTSVLLQNERNALGRLSSQRWRAGSSQTGANIERNYYLEYNRADDQSQIKQSASLNYAFTQRQFDSLPFASNGWALGVELGAGLTLGARRTPFGRVLLRGHGLWSPSRRGTSSTDLRSGRLALRAQLGAVAIKHGTSLPATLLFLAGGTNSVRGYGWRSLGVVQPDGSVQAGRYLRSGSIEWQQPISHKGRLTDWEGALFVDAGSVANKVSDLRAKVGVGAGLRWKSPLGPLQIDLAYGLAPRKWRLHLNLGFVF